MSKIAVKCSTVEEKNKVIEYSRGVGNGYANGDTDDCVDLGNGCNCIEHWYKNEGYTIIPYSQFEKEYLGVRGSSSDFGSQSHENSTSSTDLSKLPKQWCVLIDTEEKKRIVGRWFDENWSKLNSDMYARDTDIGQYLSSDYGWGRADGAIEITLGQFKKWVLKEKVDETPNPHSFTPKAGDQVQYTGDQLSPALERKVYTVDRVTGFEVHLKGYSSQWVNIDWFKGTSISISPQFTLIKPEKSEDTPSSQKSSIASFTPSTEQWTPKVGEWGFDRENKLRCRNGMMSPEGGCSNPHIYYQGQWAEIIEEPKAVGLGGSLDFSVGDWVTIDRWTQKPTVEQIVRIENGKAYIGRDRTVHLAFEKELRKATPEEITKVTGNMVRDVSPLKIEEIPYKAWSMPITGTGMSSSYMCFFLDGLNPSRKKVSETLLKPQPSPKVLVNKEVNIKISKPKQIKLF